MRIFWPRNWQPEQLHSAYSTYPNIKTCRIKSFRLFCYCCGYSHATVALTRSVGLEITNRAPKPRYSVHASLLQHHHRPNNRMLFAAQFMERARIRYQWYSSHLLEPSSSENLQRAGLERSTDHRTIQNELWKYTQTEIRNINNINIRKSADADVSTHDSVTFSYNSTMSPSNVQLPAYAARSRHQSSTVWSDCRAVLGTCFSTHRKTGLAEQDWGWWEEHHSSRIENFIQTRKPVSSCSWIPSKLLFHRQLERSISRLTFWEHSPTLGFSSAIHLSSLPWFPLSTRGPFPYYGAAGTLKFLVIILSHRL
jgi:hypothetical protein